MNIQLPAYTFLPVSIPRLPALSIQHLLAISVSINVFSYADLNLGIHLCYNAYISKIVLVALFMAVSKSSATTGTAVRVKKSLPAPSAYT